MGLKIVIRQIIYKFIERICCIVPQKVRWSTQLKASFNFINRDIEALYWTTIEVRINIIVLKMNL